MRQSVVDQRPSDASRLEQFPALAELGLREGDLAELARQGFVAPERRRGGTYYKLRFRRSGRQVVCYVGGMEESMRVSAELAILQTARRVQRELDKLGGVVRKRLRDAKTKLEPLLLERGFKFHGRAVRRPR